MSNKTITIKPSLFTLGKKTKKNKEKKQNPKTIPIISPNVLKNKLLKRIKEHKQRETQELNNKKTPLIDRNKLKNSEKENSEKLDFSNEFDDSINYLQTLSKQKRISDEKKNYDIQKQKKREELERRTLRNYHSLGCEGVQNTLVNIDLPDELLEPIITPPVIIEPYKINAPYKGDNIPYGVLKGGLKPSYREWAKTQKNNIVTNPNSSLIIEGGNMSSIESSREKRLNLLKQKIKQKELLEKNLLQSENLIKPTLSNQILLPSNDLTLVQTNQSPPKQILSEPELPKKELNQENIGTGKIVATKHIIKKTIKKKYTLGKSNMKRKVAVLIKDRGTRKKILTAQKDLKRKNINDIKEYLRDHNLIKIGSNAPNDVLKKLYESAMLTGEIRNSNPDTLLHNFSKEDKKL